MRWKGRRQSENIDDRRGASAGMIGGGLGIGGILLYLLVMALGGEPGQLPLSPSQGQASHSADDPEAREFIGVVLADTEEVWRKIFEERGMRYREPKLVLFTGQVQSACGFASAAAGPFYCPEDSQVYIDLAFYDELREKFGAPGDFAQAYVVAHEVGHHVQHLLGTTDRVHRMRGRVSEKEYNQLSVRLELQADFYAGVWAHHAKEMAGIDEQDLREALRAANAIGDDTLQRKYQGHVVPDSFTHGSAEQRARWFLKGWQTGDMNQGDTFSASRL